MKGGVGCEAKSDCRGDRRKEQIAQAQAPAWVNAAAFEGTCVYRLLCARMVLAGEFVVGTGCIGAAKERRNDDEVCGRTSSPATLKPGG